MSRRGFTMLELTLATMVGAMVLTAALGVFASMERGDTVLAKRAVENNGLEMASLAIERAIGTLVMEAGGQAGAKPDASKRTDGTAPKTQEPTGRSRFLLETDARAGLPGMAEVAAAKEGTAGSAALVAGSLSSPQRLELVVLRHPIPVQTRPAAILPVAEDDAENDKEGVESGAKTPTENRPLAVRGVFDLQPEAARPGAEDVGTTWALWWRPIERRVDDTGQEGYVGADDLAVRLATGLKSARWSVFYEESWETSHATAAVLDLPAYVKLQITTASGLEADWLFEVGWSMGPEFKKAESELEEEDEAEGELLDEEGLDVPGGVMAPDARDQPGPRRSTPNGPPKRVKPGTVKPPGKQTAPPGKPAAPPGQGAPPGSGGPR